jgi:hypothetical protein
MEDLNFPSTLMEVKNLALESKRFRTDEVPRRLREKEHITRLYNDIEVIKNYIMYVLTHLSRARISFPSSMHLFSSYVTFSFECRNS